MFSLVGLYPVANLCNLAMMLLVATVGVWAYSRYSGEYTELAATIDELTEQAWQNVSDTWRHGAKLRSHRRPIGGGTVTVEVSKATA